jgi:hypothetical protein
MQAHCLAVPVPVGVGGALHVLFGVWGSVAWAWCTGSVCWATGILDQEVNSLCSCCDMRFVEACCKGTFGAGANLAILCCLTITVAPDAFHNPVSS